MKKLLRFVLLIAIIAGVAIWGYNAVLNRQINVNHWFIGGMIKGADISSYQGEVDMAVLSSQNIKFVYAKATEGSKYVDPQFSDNLKNALGIGLPVGAYHFFSYDSSGASQAAHYIDVVGKLTSGNLIPVVDLELSSKQKENPPEKSDVVSSLRTFMAVLEEEYKVKPMIYSTKDFYDKYLADDFSEYPRWVRSVIWPVYLEAGGDWLVWQYDDHGELDGFNGEEEYIDLNVINPDKGLDALKIQK